MNMKKTIAAIAAGSVAVSAMATTVSAFDNTELRYSLVANMWENKPETWGEAVITYTIENVEMPAAGTDLEIGIKTPNFGNSGKAGSTWADFMKVTAVVDYNEASVTDRSFNFCDQTKFADGIEGYTKADLGSANGDDEATMKVVLPSASLVPSAKATVKLIATFNHCADSDADIRNVVSDAQVKVSSDTAPAFKAVYASMGAYTKWTAAEAQAKFQGYKPLKTTINGISTVWNDTNIITYLQERWFGTESKNSYANVGLLLNDAIANYDSVTFTFETAKDKVNADGFYDATNGDDKYMAFNSNFWADYNNNVISNDWYGHNFFEGVLVVNGNLTMKLWDEQSFDWTGTSISFDWDTLTAGSMTNNDYANYLHSLNLFTSTDWYWDSMVVALADGTADDATSDAGADADDEVLDDANTDVDNEEINNDDVADDTNETPAPEVSNPVTGNASVALAVIPVALAAAAVVAKKRN